MRRYRPNDSKPLPTLLVHMSMVFSLVPRVMACNSKPLSVRPHLLLSQPPTLGRMLAASPRVDRNICQLQHSYPHDGTVGRGRWKVQGGRWALGARWTLNAGHRISDVVVSMAKSRHHRVPCVGCRAPTAQRRAESRTLFVRSTI